MSMTSTATRVRLGRTELLVSPVCFGTWQLSSRFWGKLDEEPIVAAVRRAFELGVNFYDTADAYGDGRAEEVLGGAVQELPRDQIVVATKVFWRPSDRPDGARYPDLSADYIAAACDASLRRLKLDYIDLYQCHSFDPLTPVDQTIAAMERLKQAGKIRAYGTSNWTVEQMRHAQQVGGNFHSCQPPYSLLRRDIENDLLPFCAANDVGVLVYSPLQLGLLTGKYKGDETFSDTRGTRPDFQGERFRTICDRVGQLKPIAAKYGLSTVQLVLTVTLMHPGINCAIAGIKGPEHIEDASGAMGKSIEREDWYAVRNLLKL
jgi:aryl-alcohol dehydrogenase-like predicted oxidoreductase